MWTRGTGGRRPQGWGDESRTYAGKVEMHAALKTAGKGPCRDREESGCSLHAGLYAKRRKRGKTETCFLPAPNQVTEFSA